MLIEENKEKTLPRVCIDEEKGTIEISGRSVSPQTNEFFEPIMDYLQMYLDYKLSSIEITIDLEYFNTSSSRILLNLFKLAQENSEKHGYEAKVRWITENDDDGMEDAGSDYASMVKLPFEFIQKDSNSNE